MNYQIRDKKTGEKMISFHDAAGIYQFSSSIEPRTLRGTMAECVAVLDRVASRTGRRLGILVV